MKPPKSVLRSLGRNRRLRLREGVYSQMKDREWNFNRIEKDTIYLLDESGTYAVGVRVGDIDWDKFST